MNTIRNTADTVTAVATAGVAILLLAGFISHALQSTKKTK